MSAAASKTSRPTTSSAMPRMRSRTTSATSSTAARTDAPTSCTTSPLESPRDAFSVDARATSGLTALTRATPDVSKGRDLSPYYSHQLLHPHIHFSYYPPRAAARVPTPDVSLPFPHTYLYDVFARASFAQTLLVLDCTPSRDYPLFCFVSDTLFITEDAPHHLIISLQSCILRVCPMSSILLTCFTLHVPHTIQPP